MLGSYSQSRASRSLQLAYEPLATPRRMTRSQRHLESASESSAGEEPFIPPPSSLAEVSTPTAARRKKGSQRTVQDAYQDIGPSQRVMRSAGQTSHVQLPERDDEICEAEVTPRGHASQSLSQAYAARDRRQSLNSARPPPSGRSDRSGTHRSRVSELTARLPSSSPAPRVRQSLRVRASIGPHQTVSEMGLARRAELVAGVAEDCIVKLLRWSAGTDEQALAKIAVETLFRNRQTYIFSPHAPPFPDLHPTIEALAPTMKTAENIAMLGSALQMSNLAMWLYSIVQPDVAGEMLSAGLDSEGDNLLSVAADRKGKGRSSQVEADMDMVARRVRLRNELLVLAWKRFWFVVVPKENREDESAMTLSIGEQAADDRIVLNWRRPSLDPLIRPSSSLPAIPQDLMRTLFSTSAITRYGQWSEDLNEFSEDEEESQALLNGISARWRTLAKRRYIELTEKDARVLDMQFVWSRWQQEALAFVSAEVVNGSDLGQRVTAARPRSLSVKRPKSDSPEKLVRQDRDKRPRGSNGTMTLIQEDRETSVSAAEADDEGQAESVDDDEDEDKAELSDELGSERPRSVTSIAKNLQHRPTPSPRLRTPPQAEYDHPQLDRADPPPEPDMNDETYIDFDMFDLVAQEMQQEADQEAPNGLEGVPPQAQADGSTLVEGDTVDPDEGSEDSDADEEPFLPPTHVIEQVDQQISLERVPSPRPVGETIGDDTVQNAPHGFQTRQLPLFTSQGAPPQQRMFNFAAQQAQAEQIGWDDELDDAVEVKEEIHQDEDVVPPANEEARHPQSALQAQEVDALQAMGANGDGMISDSEAELDDQGELETLDGEAEEVLVVHPPLGATPARARHTSPARQPAQTQGLARIRSSIVPDEFAPPADSEDEEDRLLLTRTNAELVPRRSVTPTRFVDDDNRRQTANTERQAEILRQDRQASMFRWNEMLVPPGPRGGGTLNPGPKGRLCKSFGAYRDRELYMVDEHGDELIPNGDYVLPAGYTPPPSNLFFKGKRVDGSRKKFTEAQALLLYRTVQQVPMSEPAPISVVNYLHGEFGLLGQSLAQWNTTMMKDKLLTILQVRKNNAWPIVGRARKYCPKDWAENIEYKEEVQAIADGEEEHAKEMKEETERQIRELEEEARREAEEAAEDGDEDGTSSSSEEEIDELESEEEAGPSTGKTVARRTRSKAATAASQKKGKGKGEQAAPAKAAAKKTTSAGKKATKSSKKTAPVAAKAAGKDKAPTTPRRTTRSTNTLPDAGELVGSDTDYLPKSPHKRKGATARSSGSRKKSKTAQTPQKRAPPAIGDEEDELDSSDVEDEQGGSAPQMLVPESEDGLEPAASEDEGADAEVDNTAHSKPRRARQMVMVELTSNAATKVKARNELKDLGPAKKGRGRPRKLPQEPEPAPAEKARGRPRKVPQDLVLNSDPGEDADMDGGASDDAPDDAPVTRDPTPPRRGPKSIRGFKGAKRGRARGGFRDSMGSHRSTVQQRESTPTASEAGTPPASDDDGVPDDAVDLPHTPARVPAADQPGDELRSEGQDFGGEPSPYAQHSDGGDSSFVSNQMDVLADSPRRGEAEIHDAGETQHMIDRHIIQAKVMGEVESQ